MKNRRAVFRLAPMSRDIGFLTFVLLLLPPALVLVASFEGAGLLYAAGGIALLYLFVWLWFRPLTFALTPDAVEVVWPMRRRRIDRTRILSARLVDSRSLKKELGRCVRIGAGGLWGGFGWLWTRKRGMARMYISRTDELVLLELADGKPWLISPADPARFIAELFPAAPPTAGSTGKK